MREEDKQLKILWMDAFEVTTKKLLKFIAYNSNVFIPHLLYYPKRKEDRENGLPVIDPGSYLDNPRQYSKLFSLDYRILLNNDFIDSRDKINIWNIKEVLDLMNYIMKKKDLYSPKIVGLDKNDGRYMTSIISMFVGGIERYFNNHEASSFNNELAMNITDELLHRLFNDKLDCIICVPILMLNFDSDRYNFNSNIYLEKLTDSEQLSRMSIGDILEESFVNRTIYASSLFAIKINSTINNTNLLSRKDYYNIEKNTKKTINNWFAALRIVTGYDTGFAQILKIPQEWATEYKGVLEPIYGKQAQEFNKNNIIKQICGQSIPNVTIEHLDKIKELFKFFEDNIKNSKIQTAINRLNKSVLRNDLDDAIIDLVIALEALLSSEGENTEIHYRITHRMISIIVYLDIKKYTANDVRESMKKIYSYRSKLVHGIKIKDEDRYLNYADSNLKNVSDIAIEFVNYCFIAISKEPGFFDVKKIDNYLYKEL